MLFTLLLIISQPLAARDSGGRIVLPRAPTFNEIEDEIPEVQSQHSEADLLTAIAAAKSALLGFDEVVERARVAEVEKELAHEKLAQPREQWSVFQQVLNAEVERRVKRRMERVPYDCLAGVCLNANASSVSKTQFVMDGRTFVRNGETCRGKVVRVSISSDLGPNTQFFRTDPDELYFQVRGQIESNFEDAGWHVEGGQPEEGDASDMYKKSDSGNARVLGVRRVGGAFGEDDHVLVVASTTHPDIDHICDSTSESHRWGGYSVEYIDLYYEEDHKLPLSHDAASAQAAMDVASDNYTALVRKVAKAQSDMDRESKSVQSAIVALNKALFRAEAAAERAREVYGRTDADGMAHRTKPTASKFDCLAGVCINTKAPRVDRLLTAPYHDYQQEFEFGGYHYPLVVLYCRRRVVEVQLSNYDARVADMLGFSEPRYAQVLEKEIMGEMADAGWQAARGSNWTNPDILGVRDFYKLRSPIKDIDDLRARFGGEGQSNRGFETKVVVVSRHPKLESFCGK